MRWGLLDRALRSRVASRRAVVLLGAVLLAVILNAGSSGAQTTCTTNCVLYAGTELNLRREPSLQGEVLRFIPRGAAVQWTGLKDQNGYSPVVYEGVSGWAVALGFVTTAEEVAEFVVPTDAAATSPAAPAATTTAPAASADARVTLGPLVLRSAPAGDAAPILTMPEGAVVTLTREGAAEGYVTVEYDGTIGWAYADLLAEVGEEQSTANAS